MKIIKKSFLVSGVLVLALLAVISAFTLGNSAVKALSEKYDFDSSYTNTHIDFVIPSPADKQVSELEQNQSAGVKTVAPYYSTEASVTVNAGTAIKMDILIFAYADKMNATPYCDARILKGEETLNSDEAIVDFKCAEANGIKIGDEISFMILGSQCKFTVVAVSETNQTYQNGTIAVALTAESNQILIEQNATYSGAFVEATSYSAAEEYLLNEYKPLGRLKNRDEFDSEEAYNQHIENFNAADWSKEITICKDNYDALSVNYLNTESVANLRIYITAAIAALAVVVYTVCMLVSNRNRKALTVVARKTKDWRQIRRQYNAGVLVIAIAYAIVYVAAMFFHANPARGIISTMYISVLWMPLVAVITGAVIAWIIVGIGVKKLYEPTVITAKKKEEHD